MSLHYVSGTLTVEEVIYPTLEFFVGESFNSVPDDYKTITLFTMVYRLFPNLFLNYY